ncbi:MAG TPA: metallophosphoesterase [Flavisolibacter sp.]|jgi:hypothetical protein|nr:metallophosphoesterase [Flavisolibacter sp.]
MAYFPEKDVTPTPQRSSKDYLKSSRSELVNHLKTEVKKVPGHDISDFLTTSMWGWIYHYFKSRFGKKHPYPNYQFPDTGIYTLPDEEVNTIAITSDWATDTADAYAIAAAMESHDPDFTIHVGDTYYVGAPPEIHSNFVKKGAPWCRGKKGSFAVLGNHEMYARGTAFFKCLLPTLGLRNEEGGYTGQKAGYFCLQNQYWRILGLDTGYHSVGKPIVEFLPFCAPKAQLDDRQLAWLANTVRLGDPADKRGLVFLTHHQFITAFKGEGEYNQPATQLASLFEHNPRQALWLWGHEHKLSFFSACSVNQDLTVYGRCIGHGGTPVALYNKKFNRSARKKGFAHLVAVDERFQKKIRNTDLGFNGYAVLSLQGNTLSIAYHDHQRHLLTERWEANIHTGQPTGSIQVPSPAPFPPQRSWADAVSAFPASR